jgi:iron complex outermembrane receptor protein
VTVLGAQDLARRSITNLVDVAASTPNLRVSAGPQGGSSGHYFVRGVGQLDFIASMDPGVGVYVDGVYLGRTTGSTFDLLDVERIEVLHGPQGTLYGRNTIGGAINVVAVAPPPERRALAAVTLGERNRHEGRLLLGAPIGESLTANVAALAKGEDGWQRRLADGGRFGDERTYAARGTFDWEPSDDLDVRATLDATQSRGTADPHYLAGANAARGGRPQFLVDDPLTTWSGFAPRDDLDVRGAALTVSYALPRLTLKSIAAHRTLDSSTGIDFDGSPFPDLDQGVVTAQNQRSEELQASGTAAGGRLNWLAGAFLFREDVEQGIPIVFYATSIAQNNALDNRSTALFTHLTYALSDKLSLSGGVRSTVETKEHTFENHIEGSDGAIPLFVPTTLEDRWRSFTPKVGAEYRVRDALLLYASWSEGFRSGGFNGRPLGNGDFLAYEPETLRTLEVGVKSEWLEERLRFNGALFTSRYDDIQLSRTAIAADGTPIVVTGNAGATEVYGLEAELTAAATQHLLLSAGVGYLHNDYTRIEPGAAVPPGGKLPVAPRWTLNAAAEHVVAAASGGMLRSRIEYVYTSRYNYFFDNPPLSWEPPYRLWNLRVAYEPAADWEIAALVRNLTDERHARFREDVMATFGVAIVWPTPGREWGAELRYRF